MKVMVVDDERDICAVVERLVSGAGYECCSALDGAETIALYEEEKPDVVILDVMMPGINGFEICKELRMRDDRVGIIMLSAKSDIVDKSMGFSAGCDDYVSKPFNADELLMRIGAALRRASASKVEGERLSGVLRACGGDVEVLLDKGEALVKGKNANLTPKEFRILALLASRPGEVFTSQSVIEHVWGDDYAPSSTSIAVFVRKIRSKIEDNPSKPKYLQTVWHGGYRLGDPESLDS